MMVRKMVKMGNGEGNDGVNHDREGVKDLIEDGNRKISKNTETKSKI